MAIMIPDIIRRNASNAERRLFNRFRSELPDDAYVLHSVGLTNHSTKIWGECDYIILSRAGIFVLEVKGGQVSCEDGTWRFTGRDGISNTKAEGPFEQAKTAMFSVRQIIQENSECKDLLIGYGVIMPDEVFIQTGPEIEQGVLLDRRLIHNRLDNYLNRLRQFWVGQYNEKHAGREMRYPEKSDLENIRAILRPDIRTALTLNSSLSRVEQEQVELIELQSKILRRMDTNPRTIIKGGAGTGKTLLALDTAARRAQQGLKTLYLCFNKLLGKYVSEHVKSNYGSLLLTADSLHSWFHKTIEKADLTHLLLTPDKYGDDFFTQHYPFVYQEAVVQLNFDQFDCLIIDEGQDLLTFPYLDALDITLKGGMATGSWHLFLDPLQTIYSSFDPAAMARLKEYGYAEFQLTVNCRNTRVVANSTSIISGIDLPLEDITEGGESVTKYIVRDGNQHNILEKLIENLLKRGISRKDIVILSKHPLNNSTLADVQKLGGYRICDLAEDSKSDGIDFCTMHAFKGLERKIVIAWDLDDLDNEMNRLLHYCGLSRARSCLFVFINETQKKVHERLMVEFGERQAKTIIAVYN